MNKYAAGILLSFCAATAGAASNWTVVADLDLREAIHSYDKAIALEPGHAESHQNLAVALLLAGDINAARAGFRRSIELLQMQGRQQEAADLAQRAGAMVRLDPS